MYRLFYALTCVHLHDRAFLLCGCADGSSVSVGGGSESHRSHRDTASHQCESTHGHGDEQPENMHQILLVQTEHTMKQQQQTRKNLIFLCQDQNAIIM